MGIFRRIRKKYSIKNEKHNKKDRNDEKDNIPLEEDISTFMESDIAKKKFNAYTIPSVDLAEFKPDYIDLKSNCYEEPKNYVISKSNSYKDKVPASKLIRRTEFKCPDCNKNLYNTKLDGSHFYCPNCERQYCIRG